MTACTRSPYDRKVSTPWLLVAIAATILALTASASARVPATCDARALGMGLTYVGVLGAPTPGCTNPAAYGFDVDETAALSGVAAVPGDGPSSAFVGLRDVDRGLGAGGFAFTYRRNPKDNGCAGAMRGVYQLGKAVSQWLSVGMGIGLSRADDDRPVLTTEAGAVLKLGAFRIGAQVSSMSATCFGDGEIDTEFSPSVSVGVALQTPGGLTIAADVHDLWSSSEEAQRWYSAGAELWLKEKVALRAGVILDGEPGEMRASYSGGVGFNAGRATLDYAVMGGGDRPLAHCIGASASF